MLPPCPRAARAADALRFGRKVAFGVVEENADDMEFLTGLHSLYWSIQYRTMDVFDPEANRTCSSWERD